EAAFEMIEAARDAGCPVVVCGADVTDHAEEYLQRGATYAVLGEGDETVVELVDAIARGGDVGSIPGVVFRTPAGETRSTAHRPVMRNLDSLPLPARDLVNMDDYRTAWRRHERFSMNLVASR